MTDAVSPAELESRLRAVGEERYHDKHPFHQLMHSGGLSRGQLQAWALNRYCYQSAIPVKDAALMSRMTDPALRRAWRKRIVNHGGIESAPGGLQRWLDLTDSLGLARDDVVSQRRALPGTRFAVDVYVQFVRDRPLLEGVASLLTELFAPRLIAERVERLQAHYPFLNKTALAYFTSRLDQAPEDASGALEYVLDHAKNAETQAAVVDAVRFKCDVLWAQLDALHAAYVEPGLIPPGVFVPVEEGS